MRNGLPYALGICTILVVCLYFVIDKNTVIANQARSNKTLLAIRNSSQVKDSIPVFLTLGADTSFVTDVHGIFGIKEHGLKGSFWLKKDTTLLYVSGEKGISGNISFGTWPVNCPTPTWKTGINIYEFTLNNYGTVTKAQETIDISNVAGANAMAKFTLMGGGKWIADSKHVDVHAIRNYELYKNYGQVGVYPFKCDGCTASNNPPACKDTLKGKANGQPQPFCNVSRDAAYNGGVVMIEFLGWTK